MQRLQIADATGVWITLDNVVLDWSRSSLLSGEVVVNELSAATITLARLPTAPDDGLPAPEAAGFALPELPVSVDIDALRADRIVLDPAVLGEAVEGRFQAALSLAGGEGSANLVLERTDGPGKPDRAGRRLFQHDGLSATEPDRGRSPAASPRGCWGCPANLRLTWRSAARVR